MKKKAPFKFAGVGGLLKSKAARLALICIVAAILFGAVAYNATAPKVVPAMAVSMQQLSDSFYEDGVVRAKARSVVSADITGKVQSLCVREGQRVQAGDLLCTLGTADLDAERALLQAEREAVLAAWEQSRDQVRQQIAGLQAQKAGYNAAEVSSLYEQQIQLLDASMDPTVGSSVAWAFEQMINATRRRMGHAAAEDTGRDTIENLLDAAKAQSLAIKNQTAQYESQLQAQLISLRPNIADPEVAQLIDNLENNNKILSSYGEMQKSADQQVSRLQGELSGETGSYATQLALQSELRGLEEQYVIFLYNTQAQILALTAQQEQAAAASKSARSARNAIGEQIDMLHSSIEEDSGTASYYNTQLLRVDTSIAELDRRIGLSQVTAPIDGVCGAIDMKEGQYVSAGSMLTEIVNPDALQVECMLLTEDASIVHPGMKADVVWERRDGDVRYPCTVVEVSALAVDYISAVGLVEQRVKVVLQPEFNRQAQSGDTQQGDTHPGDTHPGDGFQVRVQFYTGEAHAIAVPRSAVIDSSEGDAVYVLQDNKAVLTPVTLGLESGDMVAVLSGLTENDVVIENPDGVQEGKAFRPR